MNKTDLEKLQRVVDSCENVLRVANRGASEFSVKYQMAAADEWMEKIKTSSVKRNARRIIKEVSTAVYTELGSDI